MPRFVKRRAHQRHLPDGKVTFVRESWVMVEHSGERRADSYRSPCPVCGADIVNVRMPRGGWVHFEGAKGLGHVKHHCLHLGEGMSWQRDNCTPDLFDNIAP